MEFVFWAAIGIIMAYRLIGCFIIDKDYKEDNNVWDYWEDEL